MQTLKAHRARALTRHIDLSSVPMPTVIAGRNTFAAYVDTHKLGTQVKPEVEALWFYLRNHAMAALDRVYDPAEPLSPEHSKIADDYHTLVGRSTLRMYYYLLQICTRESRHANNPGAFIKDYPKLKAFYESYHGTSSGHAVDVLLKNTPNVTLGEYTKFLEDSFFKSSYGSGFGGKAWGNIARVLRQYAWGEITAEMMMDTAFTLCHNNGPIFNKGMWFTTYDSKGIKEILDVQRAGMVPQYINDVSKGQGSNYAGRQFVSTQMREFVDEITKVTTDFHGSMDWARVMELGALGSYKSFVTTPEKPLSIAEQNKIKKAQAAAAEAKANQWQIMPGVFATKTKIVRVSLNEPVPA